ncbi:dynein axonemal assembly factor 4-like isoform X2 [Penaeus japonicus]|uniref:dynein axonemal assembly factor 4-like isoform X2 n=1 Tax=Penaeus japonicus TaxID=27405 RepID=UPI001C70EF5D|nr:dynein axonemal assembly factor 4-like isoform X2 [Penaeus japonicus]
MPIQVSDYKWHQTDDNILLILDLHRTSPKNVDIVTTNSYLKVSFLPYIFEVFLCHFIDTDKSSAKIAKGHIELSLAKEISSPWKELGLKLTKEEQQMKRAEAILDLERQEQETLKKNKDERNRRERFAVARQIAEDDRSLEERKKRIENEKEEFLKQSDGGDHSCTLAEAQEIVDKPDLRRRLSSTCSEEGSCVVREVDYDGDGEDSLYYSSTENLHVMNRAKLERVENANRKQRKSNSLRNAASKEKEGKKVAIPAVRQNSSIKVKFTPRVFPTPKRESCEKEEQDWLVAQSGYESKSQKDITEDSGVDYYKEKAISLFNNKDFRGCVNAYTEALKLSPLDASFYSNRAAANLALNNLHHAINDCSKALELLTPPNQENSKSRLLCHIRRGTAFVHLSLLAEGLVDYQAAHQLSPNDESLKKDMERIQAILMTSTDTADSSDEESDDDFEGSGENSPPSVCS